MKIVKTILLSTLLVSCHNDEVIKTHQSINKITTDQSKSGLVHNSDSLIGDQDFVSFWNTFRMALLNSDTSTIIALTEFPFKTRGPLDDDSTVTYSKKNFILVFTAFLNQWNGQDMNQAKEIEGIKKTLTPSKKDIQIATARVGDLEFKKTQKKWRLHLAYLNNETIESIKNLTSN